MSPSRPPRNLGAVLSASTIRRWVAALLIPALAGCALAVPDPTPPVVAAARWQAPLPHAGDRDAIATWWRRLNDPALAALIDRAQGTAPRLEAALARIEQARAQARAAGAVLSPRVDGSASLTRLRQLQPTPMTGTVATIGLDASWEIDLFGGNRRGREAALARAVSAELGWHDARVSLAAEVVRVYTELRLCEATVGLLTEDLASQQRTLDLTTRKVDTGFTAPADAALVRARLAESRARSRAQLADCDSQVKTLVAMTTLPETDLRQVLSAATGRVPEPIGFAVTTVPAALLSQRPDVAALEQVLVAASADVGVAEADRYPRLQLLGSIGYSQFRAMGLSDGAATWSFGPGLSLPLFDGSRRLAVADAARARFDEARAQYREQTLVAVQEVEQALVRIASASDREADTDRALGEYRTWLKAATSRYDTGTGSLLELEDARRSLVAAGLARQQVRAERVLGWLALYKALGGGWTDTAADPPKATAAGRNG